MAFDSVDLKAKTIYGYAYLTLEAVKSAENLDSIVKNTFARALAVAIDKALLYGQAADEGRASFAPAGIWNDENVLSISTQNSETAYDTLIKARSLLLKNNARPSALAVNAYTDEAMQLLKDTQHRYLPIPEALKDLTKIVSNQLEYSATNGSHALVFDPSAVLIGMQNAVTIEQVQDQDCLKRGLVAFRIYAMLDAAVIEPNKLCKVVLD